MKKIISYLALPFKYICVGLIYFYKFCISPFLPPCCRFRPTCSTYGLIAFKRFGVFKGGYLTARRIIRCTPWAKGGLDRVPENLKGEFKWLI